MDTHIHILESLASLALGWSWLSLSSLNMLFLCFLETPLVNKCLGLICRSRLIAFKNFLSSLIFCSLTMPYQSGDLFSLISLDTRSIFSWVLVNSLISCFSAMISLFLHFLLFSPNHQPSVVWFIWHPHTIFKSPTLSIVYSLFFYFIDCFSLLGFLMLSL